MKAIKGDWVEIEKVILEADERVAKLPEDTKMVPLISYVQGFLEKSSNVGDEASIISVIGRRHIGTLVNRKPKFTHHYGQPIQELLTVGRELNAILHEETGGDSDND